MPIYPYVCTACGHDFDTLQKISDAPLTDCPACGEVGLKKRLSAPAFHLKGTGWYETDFKNSGKGKKTDEQDKGANGEGKKDGPGKDSKAADNKGQTSSAGDDKGSSTGGESKSAAAAGGQDD